MVHRERCSLDLNNLSGLFLSLTALSGEFPTAQLSRLPSTDAYREKVVKLLKGNKLLRTYYRDGLRGLRLTASAKKQLSEMWPDLFASLFSGDTATSTPKYTIQGRLRLHRMAEVLVTMFNAGVVVFPWEKPAVFSPIPLADAPYIGQPTYYSSREVKEIGPQSTQIRGSRATGILLADSGLFVIYNTGPGQMKWEYKAEIRLKNLLQTDICQNRLVEQFINTKPSAVVFGSDMEHMAGFMGVGGDGRHNYFVLDGSFEHFYYLTSDRYGELVLQLLCDAGQRTILDDILSQDLAPRRPDWIVENDAMHGDSPVLFAYTCDMPRIKRFDTALELHEKEGTLCCFDFQEDALRQVCGPKVKIQCIDFDIYERSVFLSPENS
ncbi:hypothetical protein AALA83_12185 [Oscillospiraceae bacterium 44-5]